MAVGKMAHNMVKITSENKIKYMFIMNLVAPFIIYFLTGPVQSVIMPPRFQSSIPLEKSDHLYSHNRSLLDESEIPSYLLSINEGEVVDIKIRTNSAITINLNRAVAGDVVVGVKIFSGPDLIGFDDNNSTDTSIIPYNATEVIVIYRANSFGDRIVNFHSNSKAGHAEIVANVIRQPSYVQIDNSSAYISVNVYKQWTISVIISVVGWIYFLAWSTSFYFQVVLNYRRKSVVGLNFDYLSLNLLGFTCYSIYNFTLMFSREVQMDYYERNTYSRIPVEYNDLFFAVHAFVLTLITAIQCLIYERGEQKISIPAKLFVGLILIAGIGLYITQLFQKITLLDVVLYLSYVKLAVTTIKYCPQVYYNYERKATTGWSIHNILLDFTGGLFSLVQMFLLSYNYDDWVSIFGNFTKFGLGVISIAFDIIFVIQHYVLYPQTDNSLNLDESVPSPVISDSVISTSYRQQEEAARPEQQS